MPTFDYLLIKNNNLHKVNLNKLYFVSQAAKVALHYKTLALIQRNRQVTSLGNT